MFSTDTDRCIVQVVNVHLIDITDNRVAEEIRVTPQFFLRNIVNFEH
jgi:hypothetical protein